MMGDVFWLAGCYYIYVFCLRQFFILKFTSAMCQVDFPRIPSYNRRRWRTWWIYYVYIVPSWRGCWWLAGAVGRKGGDNDYSVVVYYDLCRPLASGILCIHVVFSCILFLVCWVDVIVYHAHTHTHTHTHNIQISFTSKIGLRVLTA